MVIWIRWLARLPPPATALFLSPFRICLFAYTHLSLIPDDSSLPAPSFRHATEIMKIRRLRCLSRQWKSHTIFGVRTFGPHFETQGSIFLAFARFRSPVDLSSDYTRSYVDSELRGEGTTHLWLGHESREL